MQWHDGCSMSALRTLSVEPKGTQWTAVKRGKKTDPIARLIEAMLDSVLIAGFLLAVGFLVSITGRLVL